MDGLTGTSVWSRQHERQQIAHEAAAACKTTDHCMSGVDRILGSAQAIAIIVVGPEAFSALTARLGASKIAQLLRTKKGRQELSDAVREVAASARVAAMRAGVKVAKKAGEMDSEKLADCITSSKGSIGKGATAWVSAAISCVHALVSRG